MKSTLALLFTALLLVSCSLKKDNKEQQSSSLDSLSQLGLSEDGDSLLLPGFEIEVKLSDKAADKLKNDKETIIVQAYLAGRPKDPNRADISEMGDLNLGGPRIELSEPGVAKFSSVRISRADYDFLLDKNFEVLINVFSGRRSTESNLLDCEILQKQISEVKGKKHTLQGKLIGE